MRIATWNVNGLRAALRKGFEQWLVASGNDVVCLQEVKMEEDLYTSSWFHPFRAYWSTAARRGYSGVATLVSPNLATRSAIIGIDGAADDMAVAEGRVLTTEFDSFVLVNAYAPHSHRKLSRLDAKLKFGDSISGYVRRLRGQEKPVVIVGDLNVAHEEIDLTNPKSNKANAGFRPEERRWMTDLLGLGLVDAFRVHCAEPGHYTWWSVRSGVRERNVGWRLDYILVDDRLKDRIRRCFHSPEQLGSDHCPVTVDIDVAAGGSPARRMGAAIGGVL